MTTFNKSRALDDVLYDIRGPIMEEAERMEARGEKILKLNIGNPMPFGFRVAPALRRAVRRNLRRSEGYANSKGIPHIREEIREHYRWRGLAIPSVDDVYIGNGISELIRITTQALLNRGDEALIPSPDYPLWTAAVRLAQGVPRHYRCDESSEWYPDVDDIARKITPRTKMLVVINPNNPTGSVYPREVLERLARLAEEHHLVLCSDEIYSQMLYDDAEFSHLATMAPRTLCFTYDGLSKNHLACGFRSGWMVVTGADTVEGDFRAGLNMLTNTRLCSNVPTQWAIPPALKRYGVTGRALTRPGGRLHRQRQVILDAFAACPFIDCVVPRAAFYLFPRLDARALRIVSDVQFALDLLRATNILAVQGRGFNYPDNAHFRLTFLPSVAELSEASGKLISFLSTYRQS